jgi:hypothetical protein
MGKKNTPALPPVEQWASLVDCLTVLALGKRKDGLNPRFNAIVKAVRLLDIVGNEKVGYFGGRHAFVSVDEVAKKTARSGYLKTIFPQYTGMIHCAEHGITESTVGHIWPKALGGIIIRGQTTNIRLECKKCNEEKYSLLTPAQLAFAKKIKIPYKW